MTMVRIAHVEPWPGGRGLRGHGFRVFSFLVVLAGDTGGRALPVWLSGPEGHGLFRGDGGHPRPGPAEAITAGLLRAAGVAVTGVHIDQLDAGSPAVVDAPAGAVARRRAGLGGGGWCGAASHPVSGRIVSGAACEASGK